MSKILISETKNVEAAKAVAAKIFALREDRREVMLRYYTEYCRMIFIYKFIQWRMQRLRFKKLPIRFDWEQELPQILDKVQQLEGNLFENLPPNAMEIVMKAKGETKITVPKTKLVLKKIKWHNDHRLIKLDQDGEDQSPRRVRGSA